ncbi:MAG: MBL fold metallo-hydrolase [Stomatobaculum sp.]
MIQIVRKVLGPVQTNVYFVFHPETKEGVIIDPAWQAPEIEGIVRKKGFVPQALFLTHGHFDHIMAAEELRDFYHIPVCALEQEVKTLEDPALNGDARFLRSDLRVHPDRLWRDGERFTMLGTQWEVLWTPGHTAGSCCLYLPEEKLLFSGDTLFQGSYGRCDMPGGDYPALRRSLTERLFALPDDVVVLPGHMEETTIGFEKRYNPIFDGSF